MQCPPGRQSGQATDTADTQLARGAADMTADRCERPGRERPGAMYWTAHMPAVCMPDHVVAASDPFQLPTTLAKRLDDLLSKLMHDMQS